MSDKSNGNGNGKMTLTRRDFLKTTAAAGAAGGVLTLTTGLQNAAAVPPTGTPTAVAKRTLTTCACCSVGCGQVVDVAADGSVLDVYGDPNHVTNRGGLCPKGAATVQWVNGDRRLGTTDNIMGITGPMYRDGDGAWTPYASWDAAITDAATRLLTARGTVDAGNFYSSNAIAFLGSSQATNEENYIYRKLIANIGSNNTEHQARI
ncbi:MAG: twin-arginine translocation signal domain-containing protein [Actinobacteria bacterium]|nr:MAG: twin-arginine translocation signal domain-containing protein [Actinomycetota bacterium]